MYQFVEVRNAASKYEVIKEASFEDKLKADEIQYNELPKLESKEQYVSARPKVFLENELIQKNSRHATTGDGTTLQVELAKPFKLPDDFEPSEFSSFVKSNVLFGDQYRFWSKNDQEKTIVYSQKHEDKLIYENLNGKLTFFLNEKNEVTSYEQTFLENFEQLSEKQEILPPIRAIETLYKKGQLRPKSKIVDVELGYSTLVQEKASQVLAPTWRFVTDDKENLFVNAFEGQIIQFMNEEKKATIVE